jgi:hypothetical protein
MHPDLDAFVAFVDVRRRENSILESSDAAGAFVRCYIPARSRDEALAVLRRALDADGFDLVDVDFCESYFWGEWEKPDGVSDEAGANSALASGTVTYGTFHTWGHDAPDQDGVE